MLYRIKQFFMAINCKITDEDEKFIKRYLNKKQLQLFNKLENSEKKHSINVARDVENQCSIRNIKEPKNLIVAALLHDIGKIEYKLNIIDKSTLVLLDKLSRGNIRKYKNFKKIDMYYNHPEKGYRILKEQGECKNVLQLVKNHHNEDIKGDIELELLKKCDDKN